MLDTIIRLFDALGNVDDGQESQLSENAHRELLMLIQTVLGRSAYNVVKAHSSKRADGTWVYTEEVGNALREVVSQSNVYVSMGLFIKPKR